MERIPEEWKPVVNYEGFYEISNYGRLRSLGRMTKGRWGKSKLSPARILKPGATPRGYQRVTLSVGGRRVHKSIHRLVAEAFIPNPDSKPCVNHLDHTPSNNYIDNLEWCTYSENVQWMLKHGRHNLRKDIGHANRDKTICKYGHSLVSPENVYITSLGRRQCRVCKKNRSARYWVEVTRPAIKNLNKAQLAKEEEE